MENVVTLSEENLAEVAKRIYQMLRGKFFVKTMKSGLLGIMPLISLVELQADFELEDPTPIKVITFGMDNELIIRITMRGIIGNAAANHLQLGDTITFEKDSIFVQSNLRDQMLTRKYTVLPSFARFADLERIRQEEERT